VNDIIEVNNEFYILAGSSLADDRVYVLKHGDTFGVFDHYGDIRPVGLGEQGLFHDGTRFLSRFDLKIQDKRPLFLSARGKSGEEILGIDLSNPDFHSHDEVIISRGTIHVARSRFLWEGTLHETLAVSNFGMNPVEFRISLTFDADFADIFEVRGSKRPSRGQRAGPAIEESDLVFSYKGLDSVVRKTRIAFKPSPSAFRGNGAQFVFHMEPRATETIVLSVKCETGSSAANRTRYEMALQSISQELLQRRTETSEIRSSSMLFNDSLERGLSDIFMMLTRTPYGLYPYAGVPWFSTPFGRDGIITALQLLWVNPAIARGVLSFLAATQAVKSDDIAESDPGKILHEMRGGEMAALGEIPFRQYYGSVDATPLFVILAGAYYERTNDREFIENLWPHVEAAVAWIDRYGDFDGDGFVEYRQRSEKGLLHQGWKDSFDGISHSDGQIAAAPVALCEVQGYVYAAKQQASRLCVAFGNKTRASELERQAAELKERFDRTFWCEDQSTFALALDGDKNRCTVRASNAGHCLYVGIAKPERAARLVRTLMSDTSFSGWGVRTLDALEMRYNPMSYHNGSIWPHDNAILAQGFARYGFRHEAQRLFSAVFDLSQYVNMNRLPELVCGFPRIDRQGPILYPVACSPQAWAAGSLFMMLQACLGIRFDAPAGTLTFDHPTLPAFIEGLSIRDLRVGGAVVDLQLHRYGENLAVNVSRRTGQLEVVVLN
jgi:glycogen debranching enzyme